MVKLQHQCQHCGRYIPEEFHYRLPEVLKTRSSRKLIEMEFYVCEQCISKIQERNGAELIEPIKYCYKDPNPVIINHVFENRQTFLNVCQSNHYQFDQVFLSLEIHS